MKRLIKFSIFILLTGLLISCNPKKSKKTNSNSLSKEEIQKLEQQMKDNLNQKVQEIESSQKKIKKLPHGIDIYDSAEEIPVPSNVKVHKIKEIVVDNWDGDFYQNEPIFIIANAANKLKNPEEAKADGWTCSIQEKKIIYFPVEYDTVIFSIKIYDGKYAYDCIPFAAYKTKNTIENMNYFYFAVQNPELIHVDLYSSKSGKMYCNEYESDYNFDAVSKYPVSQNIQTGSTWIVDDEKGIDLYNYPYGEKIATLPYQSSCVQKRDSQLCFYECIDGKYGYWILVKTDDETSGWIFTGFCHIY